MKKFFALFLWGFFGGAAIAQNTTVCVGEQVILFVQAPANAVVTWENSQDNITFSQVVGNTDSLIIPAAVSGFYRARINDNNCDPYFTDVQELTVVQQPTPANAGSNISAFGTTTTLNGNNPTSGIGTWTIISGAGGALSNPNLNSSSFTGLLDSTYTLVWTITNAPCAASSDTVEVSFSNAAPPLPSVSCNGITLYVHPTDNATQVAWGCSGIVSGATDDWNGPANTTTIVTACPAPTAAHVCDNLTAFGFSDWYLPANNQLECLRTNAATIGGFANTAYWSSTEGAAFLSANARYRTFPSGVSGVGSKSSLNNVRCVRQ
jgi:hypothetical protein